jgi:hypothetical protein
LEGSVGAVVYVFVAGFFEEFWGRVDCGIHAADADGNISSSSFKFDEEIKVNVLLTHESKKLPAQDWQACA